MEIVCDDDTFCPYTETSLGTSRTSDESEEETLSETDERFLNKDTPIPLLVNRFYERSLILPLLPLDSYGRPGKSLGEGAYGEVHAHGTKDFSVAVKYFDEAEWTISSSTLREISILIRCSNLNIVDIIDVAREGPYHYMILPLAKGNLRQFIPLFKEYERIDVTYQILSGLAYLHARRIIHRDIKPDNILVYDERNIRISDFGLAMTYGCEVPVGFTNQVYTLPYRAPEIMKDLSYTEKADVWALGATLFELYANPRRKRLFWNREISNNKEALVLVNYILDKEEDIRMMREDRVPEEIIVFIRFMLVRDPERRLSIFDLLESPLFDSIRRENEPTRLVCDEALISRSSYPPPFNPFNKSYVAFSWIYTVTRILKLDYRIYYHTIWIYDAMASVKEIPLEEIQVYLSAALRLASIYSGDVFPPSDMVELSRNNFKEEVLLRIEKEILRVLRYDIVQSVAWDWLPNKEANMALVILTLTDLRFDLSPEEMAILAMDMFRSYRKEENMSSLLRDFLPYVAQAINAANRAKWIPKIKREVEEVSQLLNIKYIL